MCWFIDFKYLLRFWLSSTSNISSLWMSSLLNRFGSSNLILAVSPIQNETWTNETSFVVVSRPPHWPCGICDAPMRPGNLHRCVSCRGALLRATATLRSSSWSVAAGVDISAAERERETISTVHHLMKSFHRDDWLCAVTVWSRQTDFTDSLPALWKRLDKSFLKIEPARMCPYVYQAAHHLLYITVQVCGA